MTTLLLTGASGYLGRAVVARAEARGWRVVRLGRPWRLGQAVPAELLDPRPDALIHLAHDWSADAAGGDANLAGFRRLLEQARAAGIARIILGSTVSARPDARNRYGRAKAAMEALLDRPGEVAARIGLVYGGPPAAQWGSLCRLAALPLLPMVAPGTLVQPIHRDEVAQGLLNLAEGKGATAAVVGLAGRPLAFGAFLRLVARCRHGRTLRLLPVPLAPALAAAHALVRLRLCGDGLVERLNGLAGLPVVDCTPGLADPALRLAAENRRRRLAAEGRRLLATLGGFSPGPAVVARYVRLAEAQPCPEIALRLLEAPGRPSPFYDYVGPGRLRAFLALMGIGLAEPLRRIRQRGLGRNAP